MDTNILTQLLDGVKMTKSCNITAGKLPKDFKATINLTCDFTGVTVGKALQEFAMPHLVVKFQNIRDTGKVEQIRELERTGYTVLATNVGQAYKDPVEEMTKMFPTMNHGQKVNFLRGLGISNAEDYVVTKPESKTIEQVRDDVKEVETRLRKAA
ncbi:MAG: hypothetical protein KAJ19_13430 [Gammaproteobacteria bacterium]|nr:hypothetical protein [Gammaproteobacteria bacterium]